MSGTHRRFNCRADQDQLTNWRTLRLNSPTSRHCTRDNSRVYPQGIQHAVDRYRRLRARVLVELDGGHGINRCQCRRCEKVGYLKPDRRVEITSDAVRWLNCRANQDAHRVRVDFSRALRLFTPRGRHSARDRCREHPQSIQQVDYRDRHIRMRVLVELDGGQGVQQERSQKCEQANGSVHRRAAGIST